MSLSAMTTRELVLRYGRERYGREGCIDARDELEHRGVLRIHTANPSGEYAEHLVEAALGGNRADVNQPHYDVMLADGSRVQVRARHVKTRAPQNIKVAHRLDERSYDELALVMFRPDYSVEWAYRIAWEALPRLCAKYNGTGYRLLLPGKWREDPAVRPLALS